MTKFPLQSFFFFSYVFLALAAGSSMPYAAFSQLNKTDFRADKDINTIPNAPTNLQILETDFDYVLMQWEDNSADEDYFVIERHEEGFEFEEFDTVDVNTTIYLDWQTEAGTDYYYRVKAVNADGESGYSNEIMGSTTSLPHTPPDAPSNLTGNINVERVVLNWQDNSDNETSFQIYKGTDPDAITFADSVGADTTEYFDYNIDPNITYYYYVFSSNYYGVSEPADTISLIIEVTIELYPPIVELSEITYNSITVHWNTVTGESVFYDILMYSENNDTTRISDYNNTEWTAGELLSNITYNILVSSNDTLGNRAEGNLITARTLPWFSEHRVTDSVIALYSFVQREENIIPDISWYNDQVNLVIEDTGAVSTGSNSIKIHSNTIIRSQVNPGKIIEACKSNNEITVECWIKTSLIPDTTNSTIIALETDNSVAFSLNCQIDPFNEGKIRYLVNLTTVTTDEQGKPDFTMSSSVDSALLQHIVYTHDKYGNETLYLNGKAISDGYRPPGYDSWTRDYSLVIGNSIDGNSPWTGELYLCSLYNVALSEDNIVTNYLASPFSNSNYYLNSTEYTLNVWPNPSSDFLVIDVLSNEELLDITESYYLQLIDITGKILLDINFTSAVNTGQNIIDISYLPVGPYFLILYNNREIIDHYKVIIVR
ncbi:MAG: T9SS type A sorting domain-containing protein [Bacteroidales bacterium]|nr:T9SS type A sorting domain-containing protein [Bacteroidales bacterium]